MRFREYNFEKNTSTGIVKPILKPILMRIQGNAFVDSGENPLD